MRSTVLAHNDVILCTAAIVATLALALIPIVRGLVGGLLRHGLRLAQSASAIVARAYDLVLPISERNAAVSKWALGVWSALNLAPVAAWIVASERGAPWQGEIALAAAVLGSINALFLSGAYWAHKESVDFMNGDIRLRDRWFGDLSTATSMPILLTALAIGIAQVAVVQHGLQEQHAMTFIVVQSSLGIRYFDHLISVLGSLPGVSFYVAAPGLSERIAVTPGLGAAWTKSIGTFCSLLVFGTLLGFLQRNRALRRMIERLLLQPVDAPIEALLRRRLLRAPSIVKRELRDAFLAEADDARKLRLLAIALEKRSFTAPIYFLLAFSQLSPIVRDKGAAMCAAFVERRIRRIYPRTQCEILQACCTEVHARAFKDKADLRRAAAIALPCMEHLLETASTDGAVLKLLRQPPLRMMLGSLLHEVDRSGLATRAASLLRSMQPGKAAHTQTTAVASQGS